jgi:tetratricopeptide (TPR) repeat protein
MSTSASTLSSVPTPLKRAACAEFKALWNFDKPDESEQRFAVAAAEAQALGDTQCELEALTQKARAQGLQQRYTEAHATLNQVEARLVGEIPSRATLRLKLEQGRVFNSAGQVEQALPLFLESWELGRQLEEDALAVDAAHMVAIAKIAEPEAALSWNLQALDLAESSRDSEAQRWLGSLYNNIGWTYFDQKRFDLALEVFHKAVALREQSPELKPRLIARWSVARVWRAQGEWGRALKAQETLLEEYARAGLESTGYVHEEIAECLTALSREGASVHFKAAFQRLSQDPWLRSKEAARLERLQRLSQP